MAEENKVKTRLPYGIGKRVKKTKGNEIGWENIEVNDIPTDKPIVVCLGGNGTISDRFANGMAKTAERFLGVKAEDEYVDIYSIRYGSKEDKMTGDLSTDEVEEVADGLFLQRVMNKNGESLSLKEACKNMRNINIVSYCYGQQVLNPMLANVANKMEYNLGYSEQEIRTVLKQVLNVVYAPYSKPNMLSTNVAFKSFSDDKFMYAFEYEEKLGLENESSDLGVGELIIDEQGLHLYNKSFVGKKANYEYQKEDKLEIDEHNFGLLSRNANWEIENGVKFLDNYSKSFALVLAMGVVNSKENQKSDRFAPLPRYEIIKEMIESEIKHNEKYLEEDKKYGKYISYGVPVEEVMAKMGVTEKDVVNKKVSFKDIENQEKRIDYSNSGLKLAERAPRFRLDLSEKVEEKVNILYEPNAMGVFNFDYIISPKGGYNQYNKNNISNIVASNYLLDRDVENGVLCNVSQNKDDNTLNSVTVEKGFTFDKEKEYESVEDLIQSVTKITDNNKMNLTPGQTRTVLNLLIASKTPFSNLQLKNGIELDESVLENEIEIDEFEQVVPAQKESVKTDNQASA